MPDDLPKKKGPTNKPSPTVTDIGNISGLMASVDKTLPECNACMYDDDANCHIFNRPEWFKELKPISGLGDLGDCNGGKMQITHGGTIVFPVYKNDGTTSRIFL